jgi:hypothetical protein
VNDRNMRPSLSSIHTWGLNNRDARAFSGGWTFSLNIPLLAHVSGLGINNEMCDCAGTGWTYIWLLSYS